MTRRRHTEARRHSSLTERIFNWIRDKFRKLCRLFRNKKNEMRANTYEVGITKDCTDFENFILDTAMCDAANNVLETSSNLDSTIAESPIRVPTRASVHRSPPSPSFSSSSPPSPSQRRRGEGRVSFQWRSEENQTSSPIDIRRIDSSDEDHYSPRGISTFRQQQHLTPPYDDTTTNNNNNIGHSRRGVGVNQNEERRLACQPQTNNTGAEMITSVIARHINGSEKEALPLSSASFNGLYQRMDTFLNSQDWFHYSQYGIEYNTNPIQTIPKDEFFEYIYQDCSKSNNNFTVLHHLLTSKQILNCYKIEALQYIIEKINYNFKRVFIKPLTKLLYNNFLYMNKSFASVFINLIQFTCHEGSCCPHFKKCYLYIPLNLLLRIIEHHPLMLNHCYKRFRHNTTYIKTKFKKYHNILCPHLDILNDNINSCDFLAICSKHGCDKLRQRVLSMVIAQQQ